MQAWEEGVIDDERGLEIVEFGDAQRSRLPDVRILVSETTLKGIT